MSPQRSIWGLHTAIRNLPGQFRIRWRVGNQARRGPVKCSAIQSNSMECRSPRTWPDSLQFWRMRSQFIIGPKTKNVLGAKHMLRTLKLSHMLRTYLPLLLVQSWNKRCIPNKQLHNKSWTDPRYNHALISSDRTITILHFVCTSSLSGLIYQRATHRKQRTRWKEYMKMVKLHHYSYRGGWAETVRPPLLNFICCADSVYCHYRCTGHNKIVLFI